MIAGRSISGNSTAELIKNLRDSKNDSSHHNEPVSPNVMSYVEFQTKMLKLFEKISKNQLSTKSAFMELTSATELFNQDRNGELQLLISWPHRDGDRELLVKALPDVDADGIPDGYIFQFHSDKHHFLTISFDHDNEIKVAQHNIAGMNEEWNNIDISSLVDDFNQVLRAKRISYISKKKKNEAIVEIHKNDITCFSKEEFDEFIHQYDDYNLTCRINNVILNNSSRRANNYTFKLMWPDCMNMCRQLKITFSRADLFNENYSWFLNEKILISSVPEYNLGNLKPGQYYYSLKVSEVMDGDESAAKKDVELLSIWLTVDGLFGELRDLKKSPHFSGNDVLNIYMYLDHLLRVRNTFICDESKLVNEDDTIRVPLRLISAISTGKTWYEIRLPGVTLFECNKFETASNGTITQNRNIRNQALNELQNFLLSDWYAMLDEHGRKALAEIHRDVLSENVSTSRRSARLLSRKSENDQGLNFGNTTIQDLTQKIFNQAKNKRMITPSLARLVGLLCEGINLHEDDKPLSHSLPDFWLKSRVKELLWGSYFWVKTSDPVLSSPGVTRGI